MSDRSHAGGASLLLPDDVSDVGEVGRAGAGSCWELFVSVLVGGCDGSDGGGCDGAGAGGAAEGEAPALLSGALGGAGVGLPPALLLPRGLLLMGDPLAVLPSVPLPPPAAAPAASASAMVATPVDPLAASRPISSW